MTDDELAEMQEYLAKATTGPWRTGGERVISVFVPFKKDGFDELCATSWKLGNAQALSNAKAIAKMRTDFPLVLEELIARRKAWDDLDEWLIMLTSDECFDIEDVRDKIRELKGDK